MVLSAKTAAVGVVGIGSIYYKIGINNSIYICKINILVAVIVLLFFLCV